MLNQEIVKKPAKYAHRPMPNLWKYKDGEHSHIMHWDITLKLLRKMTRLLGKYSLENECKMAKEIIHLIENEIKEGSENKLMRELLAGPNAHKKDSAAYRKIYFATKNVMLTFGKLMQEGNLEHQIMETHKMEEIKDEIRKEQGIIWILRLELSMLTKLADDCTNQTVPSEIIDELRKYISTINEDINKFEKTHKIRHFAHKMNPDAIRTSSE